MLHVGGCGLHTKVSFRTHWFCWQMPFPLRSSARVSVHITHLQVYKYALCSYHTKEANLKRGVYVVS